MEKKTYRGVPRSRRLTKSEVATYDHVREQVMQEVKPVKATPVKIAIAKLRALRQARGISLAELAARTGMGQGNLARIESEKNAMWRTLERYAEGIGCSLEINVVSPDSTKDRRLVPVGAAGTG